MAISTIHATTVSNVKGPSVLYSGTAVFGDDIDEWPVDLIVDDTSNFGGYVSEYIFDGTTVYPSGEVLLHDSTNTGYRLNVSITVPEGFVFDGWYTYTSNIESIYDDFRCSAQATKKLDWTDTSFECSIVDFKKKVSYFRWVETNYVLYAKFKKLPEYTVSVSAGTGGTVSGGGTVYSGKTVTISATASEGYRFVSWSDGVTDETRTLTVTSNASYVATFEKLTYVVTYSAGTYGTGTGSSAVKVYGEALKVSGALFTRIGFVQSGWSVLADGSSKYLDLGGSYTVDAPVTLYPYWEARSYTVSVVSNRPTLGTVAGGGTYGVGETVTVRATPNLRIATFSNWSDGGAMVHNFTVTDNVTLQANFAAISRTTSYGVQNSDGMGGHVSVTGGLKLTSTELTWNYDSLITFTTSCNEGYVFKRWAVYCKTIGEDGTVGSDETMCYPASWATEPNGQYTWGSAPVDMSEDGDLTFSATGAYLVTKVMAEFEPVPYTVSVELAKVSSKYGRWDSGVSPGTVDGSGTYANGSSATLTATASSNYVFVKWGDGDTTNPRTVTVSSDATYTAYFRGVTKTLTLIAASTGRGEIAFSDGGSKSREYGTIAKLKATPADHYKFVRWTDGVTTSSRTVNVTMDKSFQAEFAANDTVTINTAVTPSGGGTVSGGGEKTYDSSVTLTATPSENWEFVCWQDGMTSATRTFTANETTAAVTYTATFRKVSYAVSASGTNCMVSAVVVSGSEVSTGVYEHGTVLNLTATPFAHFHFTKWSDGVTSNPRQVTVTGAATYSAEAAIDMHTVNAISESEEKGAVAVALVSGAGGDGVYSYGSVLRLVATPSDHFSFDQWSDGDEDAERQVTVSGDAQYTAKFEAMTYTVTVSAGAGGSASIVGKTGTSESFGYGDEVTVLATPSEHYSFSMWDDGSTDNPKTFTVTGNHTLVASFAADRFTVTAVAETGGTVTGSGPYDYGSQATLKATATWTSTERYVFVGWYDVAGNLVTTTETYKPVVTGDATYTAKFTEKKYTVSATASGGGTVDGVGEYAHNSTAALTATAQAHSHFVKWTSGGEDYSTEQSITVTVTEDVSLTAVFELDTHRISTGVVDEGTGSVTGGGTYSYGSEVTLVAIPVGYYHFFEWYRNGEATGVKTSVLSVVVEEDAEYKAKFTIGEYTVSATVVPSGCGASVSGTGKYDEGETATLIAVDAGQYVFYKWSDGVTTRSRSLTVTGPVSYTAQFKLKQYTLTVESGDAGKGSVSGSESGTFDYTESETLKIMATPEDHCHFVGWKKDGASDIFSTEPVLYVSLLADTTYIAQFAGDTYAVSATAIGPGTVTGAGTYEYGERIELVASAESGYVFTSWSDGDVSNPRSYVVAGTASFTALFVKQSVERGRIFSARHAALFW